MALKAVDRCCELMALKAEIAERRQKAYLDSWNIRLEEKRRELETGKQVLAMKQKEASIYQALEEHRQARQELESRSGL